METYSFDPALEVPAPGAGHGQDFPMTDPVWQALLNLVLGENTDPCQSQPWNPFECTSTNASENHGNVFPPSHAAASVAQLPQSNEDVPGPSVDSTSTAGSAQDAPAAQDPAPIQHRFIQVGSFMEASDLKRYIIKTRAENTTCYSCAYPTCSHGDHFDARRQVITHIRRVHFDEKPFMCLACEKCFWNRQDARRHVNTRNKGKFYRCTICNKGYTRNYARDKHQRRCFMKNLGND